MYHTQKKTYEVHIIAESGNWARAILGQESRDVPYYQADYDEALRVFNQYRDRHNHALLVEIVPNGNGALEQRIIESTQLRELKVR